MTCAKLNKKNSEKETQLDSAAAWQLKLSAKRAAGGCTPSDCIYRYRVEKLANLSKHLLKTKASWQKFSLLHKATSVVGLRVPAGRARMTNVHSYCSRQIVRDLTSVARHTTSFCIAGCSFLRSTLRRRCGLRDITVAVSSLSIHLIYGV